MRLHSARPPFLSGGVTRYPVLPPPLPLCRHPAPSLPTLSSTLTHQLATVDKPTKKAHLSCWHSPAAPVKDTFSPGPLGAADNHPMTRPVSPTTGHKFSLSHVYLQQKFKQPGQDPTNEQFFLLNLADTFFVGKQSIPKLLHIKKKTYLLCSPHPTWKRTTGTWSKDVPLFWCENVPKV